MNRNDRVARRRRYLLFDARRSVLCSLTVAVLVLLLSPGRSIGGFTYTFNGTASGFPGGSFTSTFTIDTANVFNGPPTEINTSFMTQVDSLYSNSVFTNEGSPTPGSFVSGNLVSIDINTGDFTGIQSGGVGIGGGSIQVGGDLNQFWFYSAPGNFEDKGFGNWTITESAAATPEPAALVVWTVLGLIGLGFVSLQKKYCRA